MDDLDARLKAHYERLGRDTLRTARATITMPRASQRRWQPSAVLGLGCTTAALAALLLLTLSFERTPSTPAATQSTALVGALREAAMNHASALGVEVRAYRIDALDRALDRLPFELLLPARLEDKRVVGARYCSIGGRLAAHVTIDRAAEGRTASLFVTSAVSDGWPDAPEQRHVDGVEIETWLENGLRYLLAMDAI